MLKDIWADIRSHNSFNAMWVLAEVMGSLLAIESYRMWRGRNTGAWIIVQKYTVNRKDIMGQE